MITPITNKFIIVVFVLCFAGVGTCLVRFLFKENEPFVVTYMENLFIFIFVNTVPDLWTKGRLRKEDP
jgi:hypothetical protein